ncbi:OsmC family protein [bacterium]|nr:OsmC family protein [bacterium]
MRAHIRYSGNMSFIGKADSNHFVVMDASKKVGGEESAVKPIELILIGLGGCTGVDVVSILSKMRAPLENLEISIEAEQSDDFPKVFTNIHIDYTFYGQDLKNEQVERAINLSKEKYCSVSVMLSKSAEMSHSYKIISDKT